MAAKAAGFSKFVSIEGNFMRWHEAVTDVFKGRASDIPGTPRGLPPEAKFILGDSREMLPHVLKSVAEPCTIFLDAHERGRPSPLESEIQAIINNLVEPHRVIIDDYFRYADGTWTPTIAGIEKIFSDFKYKKEGKTTKDSIFKIYNYIRKINENLDNFLTRPEKIGEKLSGGDKEWRTMEYYNTPWCDCYLDFQTEFGLKIINIIKKSKTLGDIRDYYIEYLNLPILYDFALSKNLLKAY